MQRIYFLIKLLLLDLVIVNKNVIAIAMQKEQYQGLMSGQGLYNSSDNVVILNASSFKTSVFGDSKGWLVEFYNSWCGFCYRFAPTWKALANDIYSWKDIVTVAAIDCADDDNNPICREYEIMRYPMLKYFPINAHSSFMGIIVEKGETVDAVKHNLIMRLEKEQQEGRGSTWPNITPYRNVEIYDIWKAVPKDVKYVIFIFEEVNSHLGTEIILDMRKIPNLLIRRVTSDNALSCIMNKVTKFPSFIILNQEGPHKFLNIKIPTREGIRRTITEYMISKGINIRDQHNADHSKDLILENMGTVNNTKSFNLEQENDQMFGDYLFQIDLENTLHYSINHEIPMTKVIEGEKMNALKLYINILAKYFPLYSSVFLDTISDVINKKEKITGEEFIQLVRSTEEELSPVYSGHLQWISCKGSKETLRGYPCGLWTMFHMLTVNSAIESKNNPHYDPIEVLRAMHSYIKHFFGCADCSKHFIDMARKNKIFQIHNGDENIMWLWKSHNEVNARLAGDETEDPKHKKIQYPSDKQCPTCRHKNDTWNEIEVLHYLKKKYSYAGINYYGSNDNYNDDNGNKSKIRQERLASSKYISLRKLGWDFTIFDISICVVLYIISAAILILVCIKFAVKRSYKKKTYVNLLGKV